MSQQHPDISAISLTGLSPNGTLFLLARDFNPGK
jgi:hypothetical protein